MRSWDSVKKDDVLKAIDIFNRETPDFKDPRSTYLVYDGVIYPGKQIRRMSYEVAFGVKPEEKGIYGGKPTIDFFERLGFETYWTTRDVPVSDYDKQIMEMKTREKL